MTVDTIGDYSILKELGPGPFGSVYLAEHRFIKKQFALKLLPEELVQKPSFLDHFEKEIALLAHLDHPSLVKMHNVSQFQGQYFIVMDPIVDHYANTMNLQTWLEMRGRPFDEEEVETILRQIANVLDYLHKSEVHPTFHGGLKPNNILVQIENKIPKIFITDYGFFHLLTRKIFLEKSFENFTRALAESDQWEHQTKLYESYLQNFYCLSPEQKRPHTELTVKTDLYAIGVLTYYLFTQKYPEGYFEMPTALHPQLKKNWNFFIASCMQMDPKKRPESLLWALDHCLDSNEEIHSIVSEDVEKAVEDKMQMSFEFKETKSDIISTQSEKMESQDLKPFLLPQEIERPQYDPDPGAIFQRENRVSHYEPEKQEVQDVKPLQTSMVVIPGGTYQRGSNFGARDELPKHSITIHSFALDVHPVTNEQFILFLQAMGGEKDHNNNDIVRLKDSRIKRNGGRWIVESGYLKHPVVGVTWYGAVAYAKWVGKRLPTEAEWEIASYGDNDQLTYPTGEDIERSQANFFSSDTTNVQSYPPNEYGLYDMAGNVYEWCQDWYAYNYYDISMQEPENPKGPPQGVYRVLRGGCWKSLKEDLRCAHRHRNNPGTVNGTYGFRCAADAC